MPAKSHQLRKNLLPSANQRRSRTLPVIQKFTQEPMKNVKNRRLSVGGVTSLLTI